jgi:hypothetical protein
LENPSLALRNGLRVKVAAMTATTHNPSEEPCWVSCLRENFMSSSYGEELETGPAARSAPRQFLTRQRFFAWIQWQRRILVRWEYHANNLLGFGVLQRHKERRATRDRKRCRKAA